MAVSNLTPTERRARRTRTRLKALAGGRPRLSVFRSAKNIYAQIIDDTGGVTLAHASSLEGGKDRGKGADKDAAAKVGAILVNINPAYQREELRHALAQSGCRALVSATGFKSSDYAAMLDDVLACAAIGSPDTVRDRLAGLIAETGADELILTSQIHDHRARVRSFEIAADVRSALAAKISTI